MQQYLELLARVATDGVVTNDRTGVGRKSLYGQSMQFNLREGFPLVTTRKVGLKVAAEELFWFISGSCDVGELRARGVKIWDHWAVSESHIDSFMTKHLGEMGLDDGAKAAIRARFKQDYLNSIGNIYGPNWRKKKAEHALAGEVGLKLRLDRYSIEELVASDVRARIDAGIAKDAQMLDAEEIEDLKESLYIEEYMNNVDQLHELVLSLKHDPDSRRHVMSAWDPASLPIPGFSPQENVIFGRGALAPCHALFQCFVDTTTAPYTLSGLLYQRSCDLPVGAPFNIAQYSLFIKLLAHSLGYQVGSFHYHLGDVHIYTDQLDLICEQLNRRPMGLCEVEILSEPKEIYQYSIEDLRLVGYDSHPHIQYPVAV